MLYIVVATAPCIVLAIERTTSFWVDFFPEYITRSCVIRYLFLVPEAWTRKRYRKNRTKDQTAESRHAIPFFLDCFLDYIRLERIKKIINYFFWIRVVILARSRLQAWFDIDA